MRLFTNERFVVDRGRLWLSEHARGSRPAEPTEQLHGLILRHLSDETLSHGVAVLARLGVVLEDDLPAALEVPVVGEDLLEIGLDLVLVCGAGHARVVRQQRPEKREVALVGQVADDHAERVPHADVVDLEGERVERYETDQVECLVQRDGELFVHLALRLTERQVELLDVVVGRRRIDLAVIGGHDDLAVRLPGSLGHFGLGHEEGEYVGRLSLARGQHVEQVARVAVGECRRHLDDDALRLVLDGRGGRCAKAHVAQELEQLQRDLDRVLVGECASDLRDDLLRLLASQLGGVGAPKELPEGTLHATVDAGHERDL